MKNSSPSIRGLYFEFTFRRNLRNGPDTRSVESNLASYFFRYNLQIHVNSDFYKNNVIKVLL